MSYIVGFAGSNSSTSINYQLVRYTASLIQEHEVKLVNMANQAFPMYSEDYEKEKGHPDTVVTFNANIQKASAVILSVNEHNSNPSAFFKNVIDWLSRVDRDFIRETPVFLMATSGGKRGAKSSLEVSEKLLNRFGAEITGTFSLPGFSDNFEMEKGILDVPLASEHAKKLQSFLDTIR